MNELEMLDWNDEQRDLDFDVFAADDVAEDVWDWSCDADDDALPR